MSLPVASDHLVRFGAVLRAGGLLATPDQAMSFLRGVRALGPRSFADIHSAAVAIYGPTPDQRARFDELFDAHFLGRFAVVSAPSSDDDTRVYEESGPEAHDPQTPDDPNESGQEASALRSKGDRALLGGEDAAQRQLRREGARALPHRRGRRRQRTRRGDQIDLRRLLRRAVAHDGELMTLPQLRRKQVPRPILVLIDVSGSMKDLTDGLFRLAYDLVRLHGRVEVFALGTDLSRVTQALKIRNRAQALAHVSAIVPDWDGGTRLGDTLETFLAVPRFTTLARGALVLTLSDGLERGDPDALERAAARMRRLCWRHLWLTPLADGPGFRPKTEALMAIAPDVHGFGSAASIPQVCAEILHLARSPISKGGKL